MSFTDACHLQSMNIDLAVEGHTCVLLFYNCKYTVVSSRHSKKATINIFYYKLEVLMRYNINIFSLFVDQRFWSDIKIWLCQVLLIFQGEMAVCYLVKCHYQEQRL